MTLSKRVFSSFLEKYLTIQNMATATVGNRCAICGKQNAILKCGGCSRDFCYNDFGNHRQELNKQLNDVEINRDLFSTIT